MKLASIFTGFGGFDIAAEWMNWEVQFQCENNDFCQKILSYYWPYSVLYGDIKATDFRFWRGEIDILVGGPPCQPASTAGKRKGTNDDRWLWPEAIRALREIKPKYAIFENPIGILSLENGKPFEWILSQMENEGYKIEIFNIPACGIEAAHERQRIWIIAHSTSNRRTWERQGIEIEKRLQPRSESTWKLERGFERLRDNRITSHSMRERYNERSTSTNRIEKWTNDKKEQEITDRIRSQINRFSKFTTDSKNKRLEGKNPERKLFTKRQFMQSDIRQFPTQSPICSRNDGFSDKLDGITFPKWRNESIKGFGNAIYPPIAFELFKAIEQWEHTLT